MKVAIMSFSGSSWHSLAWHSGHGSIRTYEKDRYDSRLRFGSEPGSNLPFFDDREKATSWMIENIDEQCQVTLPVARALLGHGTKFDTQD
jgi:hypothetical protein